MQPGQLIQQMELNGSRIRALVEGVSLEQARWRPEPGSWSILEVINHLLDEEREDFRLRLDIILHRPAEPWPPIDPQGWITARRYNERQLEPSLQNFLEERKASLAWLRNLSSPDWNAAYETKFGRMTAGDMLASWAAHDLLHMRQLVELQRAYLVQIAGPYAVGYAGDW